jgi:hypothetical protein
MTTVEHEGIRQAEDLSCKVKSYEDFKYLMKGLPPKASGQSLHPLIFEVLSSNYKTSPRQIR